MTLQGSVQSPTPKGDGDIRIEDCEWYHHYDFLDGHPEITATYDIRGIVDHFLLPKDLTGKRCLDVGTASGFFTFEMEKRGAAEVVSFDLGINDMWDQVPFAHVMHRTHEVSGFIQRLHNGYWYAHRKHNSRATVARGNVLAISPELGPFDVVFVGAILQHVHDPIGAIIGAARLARETLIISEAFTPSDQPVMLFQPHPEVPQYWTWWTFTPSMIQNLLGCLGFTEFEIDGPFDCVLKAGGAVPSFTIKAIRPTFPTYRRGERIEIMSDHAFQFLTAGWLGKEAGRRMARPTASLAFNLEDDTSDGASVEVTVGGAGGTPEGAKLEVYVNRILVGSAPIRSLVAQGEPMIANVPRGVMQAAANKTITLAVTNPSYPFHYTAEEVSVWPLIKSVTLR